ncbi:MAG TPA: mechanosensitive ion channel domain-containing protein [Longimicrobiales bacterium]|nr:mechanosensitive ion channel domain-containing protein [Longimicrobiales bacterium]
MSEILDLVRTLSAGNRILLILLLALLAHVLVLLVRRVGRVVMDRAGPREGQRAPRHPKIASVATLVVSALTFTIYFGALGLILGELGISLTAYFASATVIGLAIGFGSQGLVQDIVIGLTLIFSDVIDVGDVADVGGQTGRVESIGLRFTTLRTLLDQRVVVPNRNVGQINRYRNGYVRAYLDVEIPDSIEELVAVETVERVVQGAAAQHSGIVVRTPELLGVRSADPGGWRYLRVKLHIWPGQGALLESTMRQRVLAALRCLSSDYADWMVTVTYRVRE